MWIFLPNSFLSIVACRGSATHLLARARFAGDIERVFPRAKVQRTPAADYMYRAKVTRRQVARWLSDHALEDLDYDNVKGAIDVADRERHDTMLRVWTVMLNAQEAKEAPMPRPRAMFDHRAWSLPDDDHVDGLDLL